MAALDFHLLGREERRRGPELDLDALGRALADEQVVLAADELRDRLVHRVAGHAHRLAVDDAGQRDDRDVGGAAADVDDHVARGFGDRQAGADRRRHPLLDEVHLARLGAVGAVLHGAALDLGDLRRHADDDARADEPLAAVRLLDEVAEHLLGGVEVGDDAVAHRPDGRDAAGVRPSISLASVPTASIWSLTLLTATIEGSFSTMPAPRAKTQVLAVPRSMARSLEKNENAPSSTRASLRGVIEVGGKVPETVAGSATADGQARVP